MIWSVVILLSLLSLLAVYSATGSLAWRMDKSSGFYMVKQLGVLIAGIGIIFVVHRINYTKFKRFSVLLFLLCIPLLIYTLFFGTSLNEGSRWIKLPIINLTFQTSDLARLAIFMFLARQLSIKQKVIKDFRKGFLPVLVPVLIICGLIAPANLSTALLLGLTCCILFFIGRVDVKHIMLLAAVGLAGVILLFMASKALGIGRGATWEKRIENYMGTGTDDKDADSNYQSTQAKIAIASGGLTGRGPGKSWARDFLPHPLFRFHLCHYHRRIRHYRRHHPDRGIPALSVAQHPHLPAMSLCFRGFPCGGAQLHPGVPGIDEYGGKCAPGARYRPYAAFGKYGRFIHLV